MNFSTINEAVLFMVEGYNRLAEHSQAIYRATEEERYKSNLIQVTRIRLLCDKLETYGYKISSEELEKESRKIIERDWLHIKKEVAEMLKEREKAVEDLLRSANDNDQKDDSSSKSPE